MNDLRHIGKIFVLTIFFTLSAIYTCWAADTVCTVTEDVVNVRSGPGTSYDIVAKVSKGEVFTVLDKQGDWYSIKLTGGTGWIAGWLISIDNKAAAIEPGDEDTGKTTVDPSGNGYSDKKAVVLEDIVNVRTAPGTDNPIAGKVYKNQELKVLQNDGDWYKIEGQSVKGWVAGWLLSIEDETDVKDKINKSPSEGDAKPPAVTDDSSSILSFLLDEDEHSDKATSAGQDADKTDAGTDSDIKLNDLDYSLGQGTINYEHLSSTTAYVVCDDVNIRSQANADSEIVSKVNFKDMLEITGKDGDFYEVKLADGKSGWVADFLVAVIYRDSSAQGSLSGKAVLLDAGHGEINQYGVDPGSIGRVSGVYEKDITIDIAAKTKDLLIKEGAVVIMARSGDSTILTKKGRANVANFLGADIYLSIHTNSNDKTTPNGTSTYYYAPETNQLLYSQRDARNALASSVQAAAIKSAGRKDLGVLQENFAVIRETKMPSVLIETAFISNAEEEALLKDSSFRSKMAEGILNGIVNYFK